MENWSANRLGNLCLRVASGGTPLKSVLEYYENGTIPWLKTGEIKKGLIYDTEEKITENGFENSSTKLIPVNSVIVAMYGDGDTAGNVAINKIPLTTNQACCNFTVNPEQAHYRFIYYYLKGSYSNLVNLKLGGSQQNLNAQSLKNFPINHPRVETQKKIAATLSAYDELIENNLRRIALLEKMAEEIYREWFVRLRFPGHNKMKVVKGVPEGWRAIQFNEICEFQKGKTPDQLFLENQGGLLPYITVEFIEGRGTEYVLKKQNSIVCENGDVLMLMDGARSGLVFRGKKGIVGSTFARVAVKTLYRNVVYEFLRATREHIVSNNTGSAIPHANKEFIHRLMMFLPENEDLIEMFNDHYRSLIEQSLNLVRQNELLSRSRDALLPRLISGKLSVENLDIQFPTSMQETAYEI